ncbi:uncharacterized protein LOC119350209 [Triticum dicoccoides]|uniref:uncharacterized protein LOC119350209 n=1 Tax=Triticum dicoccoides TaxID=85692 RepID=UPI00188E9329|nr:uncharacterized protein LOC119350209 [Triticum dicoccoides]
MTFLFVYTFLLAYLSFSAKEPPHRIDPSLLRRPSASIRPTLRPRRVAHPHRVAPPPFKQGRRRRLDSRADAAAFPSPGRQGRRRRLPVASTAGPTPSRPLDGGDAAAWGAACLRASAPMPVGRPSVRWFAPVFFLFSDTCCFMFVSANTQFQQAATQSDGNIVYFALPQLFSPLNLGDYLNFALPRLLSPLYGFHSSSRCEHTYSGDSPSLSENHDRSQFTDLTNNSTSGKDNHAYETVHAIKPQGSKGWYARMSDEKKAEYLLKWHQARAEKKAANANCQQVSQQHSSSCLSLQRTCFTDITNTGTTASSGNSDRQPAVTNVACKKQGWYTGLSEEKKAQHLQKLRLARLEKKVAAKSVTANVPQSHTPPLSTGVHHQVRDDLYFRDAIKNEVVLRKDARK